MSPNDAATSTNEVHHHLHWLRGAVAALEPTQVPLPDASGLWQAFATIERLAVAAQTLLAGRVEESKAWQRAGYRSAAEYLARQSGSSIRAARASLTTGRRLADLPATTAALRRGELSLAQCERVADAAVVAPEREDELLATAGRVSLAELAEACGRIKAAADPDPDATYERIHRNRRLRQHTDAEGAWHLHGYGTVEAGSLLNTALGPLVDELYDQARASGDHQHRDTYVFDALVELLHRAIDGHYDPDDDLDEDDEDSDDDDLDDDLEDEDGDGNPDDPDGEFAASSDDRTGGWGEAGPDDPGGEPTADATPDGPAEPPGADPGPGDPGLNDERAPHSDPTSGDDPTGPVGQQPAGDQAGTASPTPKPGDPTDQQGDQPGPHGRRRPKPNNMKKRKPKAGRSGNGTNRRKKKRRRRSRDNPRYLGLLRIDYPALVRGHVEGDEICEISGVGPIPVHTALRLLDESTLKLVITKGTDVVNVTHLGRRPTVAQHVALLWQNPSCSAEGCPHSFVQVDHRDPWAATHRTVLGQLDRLCLHDHDLKTHHGWSLVEGTGTRPFVPPTDPRHPNNTTATSPARPDRRDPPGQPTTPTAPTAPDRPDDQPQAQPANPGEATEAAEPAEAAA
jgi:hypothetical protein